MESKAEAVAALEQIAPRLADLQQRLYAEAQQRVVLVLQAMDSGGKDGVVRRVVGLLNPDGVRITAFGRPTAVELAHDFLWRVDNALPLPRYLGVWNRSHYEDVLIARVHDLVPKHVWKARYDRINAWERELVANRVTFVKCFLQISYEEQRQRLLGRLDDPTKHWKVDPADVEERRHWADYQDAYTAVLERCSTDEAPWYRVPADRKWYRDWAVASLLLETLEDLDPQYPQRPDLDLDGMRAAIRGD